MGRRTGRGRVQLMPVRPLALALATACLLASSLPVRAQFYTSSGAVSTTPTDQFPINGAQQTLNLTGFNLLVGNFAPGSFAALAGAQLTANQLAIGNFRTGVGSTVITGAGTIANLVGANGTRMDVASWGIGTLTVSAGAVLDAASAACVSFCGTLVGNGAGSTGVLNLSGVGSEVRTLNFIVGQSGVVTNPPGGFDFGTPGGTTNAFVNVLTGARLTNERATVGSNNAAPNGNGNEKAFGTVVVDGANSQWRVKNFSQGTPGNQAAGMTIGNNVGGTGTVTIRNQGKLLIDGTGGPGPNDFLNIASNGGKGTLTVTGVGSSFDLMGVNTVLQVGRSGASAQGTFSVLAGATASTQFLNVARDSAAGTVLIDGVGSLLSQVGVGTNQSLNVNGGAHASIGRTGGQGQVTVSNGGRWLLSDGGGDDRVAHGPGIVLGRDVGSNGRLTISGAGSRVEVTSTSLGLAPGVPDNFNPFMAVGFDAGSTGQLTVSNGGKLLLTGNAASTLTNGRTTLLSIGGYDAALGGRQGTATVTGAGSEIIVGGFDAQINVGRGAGSSGQLDVLSQARVAATSLGIGTLASGTVNIDNAAVALSGVRTNVALGAGISVGRGAGGSGAINLSNAGQLTIENNTLSGGMSIGGDQFFSGGSGIVSLTGGSSITSSGTQGGSIFVGRSGSGVLSLAGASTVNVATSSVRVGTEAGGFGLVTLAGNSTMTAGYIGLAINQGVETGGIATMIVNNSTVNVGTLEVGLLGFLGGNNATINGNVILHGTLSPGESPGRININGSIRSGSGLLVLDIASNGQGGFDIDHLVLTQGSTFDFTGLDVRFNFLGDVNPADFAATGGMDLDNFLQSIDGNDVLSDLSSQFAPGVTWAQWFGASQLSAQSDVYDLSNLSITPDGVVTFTAALSVPEPGSLALVLLALLGVGGLSRRQRRV